MAMAATLAEESVEFPYVSYSFTNGSLIANATTT